MKIGNLEKTAEEGVSHNKSIRKKVMLKCGEIPHITQFAQSRFPSGSVAEEHSHKDMYEIFFVERGRGTIRVDNINYKLKQGFYVVVEPGETHEVISEQGLVLNYFGLKAE